MTTEQPSSTMLDHLVELRTRLLRAVGAVLIIFVCLVYFANDIYHLVALPLIKQLPVGSTMIATDIAAPFFTPFKLTIVVSAALAMPVILYQIWGFIAPGLYQNERRLALPLLFSSIILFYGGIAFAYFVVFPLAFSFFTGTTPHDVQLATDISSYLDLVLKIFFAFGLAFEVPVAVVLLVMMGIVERAELAAKRPYIIVAAFVVGMLLTPPDVISQTCLAVPIWLLFELGLVLSYFYRPAARSASDTNNKED